MQNLDNYEARIKKHKDFLYDLHNDVVKAYTQFMKHRLNGKKPCRANFKKMFAVIPSEYIELWKFVAKAREVYGEDLEAYLNYIDREKTDIFRRVYYDANALWADNTKDYHEIKGHLDDSL